MKKEYRAGGQQTFHSCITKCNALKRFKSYEKQTKRRILIMYVQKGRHNECNMSISRRMPMTNTNFSENAEISFTNITMLATHDCRHVKALSMTVGAPQSGILESSMLSNFHNLGKLFSTHAIITYTHYVKKNFTIVTDRQ